MILDGIDYYKLACPTFTFFLSILSAIHLCQIFPVERGQDSLRTGDREKKRMSTP